MTKYEFIKLEGSPANVVSRLNEAGKRGFKSIDVQCNRKSGDYFILMQREAPESGNDSAQADEAEDLTPPWLLDKPPATNNDEEPVDPMAR